AHRLAELGAAPGDRHDAGGAGEGGDVEHDLGGAVRRDGDDAGIKRERRLARRRAFEFRRRHVAARADAAAAALHAIDQLAVAVADLGGETALAQIIVVWRRRLVVGEVEDADVDGGDDQPRLLARGEAADL